MTHEEVVDVVARAIRDSWDRHSQIKHGLSPLTPWDELPEPRKGKWRGMAQAAIEVIRA